MDVLIVVMLQHTIYRCLTITILQHSSLFFLQARAPICICKVLAAVFEALCSLLYFCLEVAYILAKASASLHILQVGMQCACAPSLRPGIVIAHASLGVVDASQFA